MTEGQRRVFIVDDHPIVRQGLALFINREGDLTVCGDAEEAGPALQRIQTLRPDIVLVDITHPMMRPVHDPIRSLIYAAGDRAVRTVYVDGQKVVEDGRVLTMDYPGAAAALHEAQKRVKANVPNLDWDHRTAEQISPLTFRTA